MRPPTQELFKHGLRVKLPPQAFQVLHILLQHRGQLVTREELQHALWPSDTFVDFDHGLNSTINKIRDVFNDSAEEPRYIETLPRLGYRFIGQIENGRMVGVEAEVFAIEPTATLPMPVAQEPTARPRFSRPPRGTRS